MRKLFLPALLLWAITANAQSRVFVSAAQGNDMNPCSVTLPCRSFAHAITVVAMNGEILALDSGGYGPVSITISVSIVGPPGVEASVTQPTGHAIDINAPSMVVLLRGLSIFGLAAGGNEGIYIAAANLVQVESCNVTGFAIGIDFYKAAGRISISNTKASNNGTGISLAGTSNDSLRFEIDHAHLDFNGGEGLFCWYGVRGTIRDSVMNGNGFYGVEVVTQATGQTSLLEVENCTVTDNMSQGIAVASGAPGALETVRV